MKNKAQYHLAQANFTILKTREKFITNGLAHSKGGSTIGLTHLQVFFSVSCEKTLSIKGTLMTRLMTMRLISFFVFFFLNIIVDRGTNQRRKTRPDQLPSYQLQRPSQFGKN